MPEPGAHELTELLEAWSDGEEQALEKLAPLVHAELYRLAKRYMSRERPDHLLQTSALINEAYIRLIDWKSVRWQNRAHFFGVAAQMLRAAVRAWIRTWRQFESHLTRRSRSQPDQIRICWRWMMRSRASPVSTNA